MGLLRLLTLPITGPPRLGWWIIEQVVGAAEAELYDEDRIVAALRRLTAEVEEGRISEEEHAAAEGVLLARLAESRARRRDVEEIT
ncbi:MAG: gas vesicle protein GvpG [Actinobacteria bacterium]|nr:gas vesicle protein GvpG [Actinomycetota bacterium]